MISDANSKISQRTRAPRWPSSPRLQLGSSTDLPLMLRHHSSPLFSYDHRTQCHTLIASIRLVQVRSWPSTTQAPGLRPYRNQAAPNLIESGLPFPGPQSPLCLLNNKHPSSRRAGAFIEDAHPIKFVVEGNTPSIRRSFGGRRNAKGIEEAQQVIEDAESSLNKRSRGRAEREITEEGIVTATRRWERKRGCPVYTTLCMPGARLVLVFCMQVYFLLVYPFVSICCDLA